MQLFRISTTKRVKASADVYLHDNARSLRQSYREHGFTHSDSKRVWGFAVAVEQETIKGRRSTYLGQIHLTRSFCPPWVWTHEIAHLAVEWMRRTPDIVPAIFSVTTMEAEEMLCYLIGNLAQEIHEILEAES